MSSTPGASNPIPTVVKVLVALALMMFLAPFVVVVLVFLLSAMAGSTWYYATTSTVAASRVSAVRSTMSQLRAGVQEGTPASCGDPEAAMAAARSQGMLKTMLRPEEPAEACLLALGADPSPLYGRFWVVAGPPFEIHGVVDLDEDGELLHLVLSEGQEMQTLSED